MVTRAPRHIPVLSFLVLLLLCISSRVGGDLFESFDTNHDGSIDRQEYDSGMSKLSAAVGSDAAAPTIMTVSSWFSLPSVSGGFWNALTSGIAMILATEIGDKTFFIAAVLSMRHDRGAVFGGAIAALCIMTVLSSAMGLVLPSVLPKQYTHWLGGILFLYFGIKLMLDSRTMQANRVSEELEEVEEELLHPKKADAEDLEEAGGNNNNGQDSFSKKKPWTAVFMQSLSLTFLAEWGDRSQIATIALASHKNPYGVTVGGCIGHSVCTGLAVVGGRMLAARISEKTVAFWGGVIFLIFGVHSIFWEE